MQVLLNMCGPNAFSIAQLLLDFVKTLRTRSHIMTDLPKAVHPLTSFAC